MKSEINEEIIIADDFNYDGYQVVRGEFFAHFNEPSITFNNDRINLNTACVNKLPNTKYIQFLVNPDEKNLIVKPSTENTKDSIICYSINSKTGKKRPKYIKCKIFCGKIFTLMNWNADLKYKLLGKLICSNGEYIFLFDLTSTEVFKREASDGKKVKNSRIPAFPEEWKDQFGLPVEEHKKSFKVNTFDGYVVFGLKENENLQESNSGTNNIESKVINNEK